MLKYKVIVEYEGTGYHGWQYQKNIKTIQDEVEKALFKLTGNRIIVYGASRTDAGVHSYGQVAHFEICNHYNIHEIQNAINYYLKPQKISIVDIELVNNTFHARFSKKTKCYIYKIINRKSPLTIQKYLAWHVIPLLDINNMIKASKYIIGNFDFSSFRASGCQSNSPIKTIDSIEIIEDKNEINLIFTAESFLYNQIRIMVGTLKDFGVKPLNPSYMKEIINAKNRKFAGETAPSCGLYLNHIYYKK